MKANYRIRNWNDYNKSLIQRGSITVWLSEDAIKKWTAPKEIGKKGRPKLYSDDAILNRAHYSIGFSSSTESSSRISDIFCHDFICGFTHSLLYSNLSES